MANIEVLDSTVHEEEDSDLTTIYRTIRWDSKRYLHTIVLRGSRVSTTMVPFD